MDCVLEIELLSKKKKKKKFFLAILGFLTFKSALNFFHQFFFLIF
jgi:uncharacterized membrane-anchored protein YitT (DUF2179 family)